jgi:tetratricopeptide (TPR) repeat protein
VLGTNALLRKDYDEAVRRYSNALKIAQKNFPQGHRNVMLAHYNVGLSLVQMRRYAEALEHLEASLAVRESLPSKPKDSPQAWRELMLTCQLALGRYEKAKQTAEASLADPAVERSSSLLASAAMAHFASDLPRTRALAAEALETAKSEKDRIKAQGVLTLLDSVEQLQGAATR